MKAIENSAYINEDYKKTETSNRQGKGLEKKNRRIKNSREKQPTRQKRAQLE